MALERSVDEFNITNYSNIANASAANIQINIELKVTDDEGQQQTYTRNARFIQDIWNQMAADPDGREVLRSHVNELARVRALVFAGVNTYADFI